jgi:hypothetical protein
MEFDSARLPPFPTGDMMNRRELLFGAAAAAIAPALPTPPIQYDVPGWQVLTGADGNITAKYVIHESPDTKYLAANDDFAMAA